MEKWVRLGQRITWDFLFITKTLERFNILRSGLLNCIVYPPSLTLATPLASATCWCLASASRGLLVKFGVQRRREFPLHDASARMYCTAESSRPAQHVYPADRRYLIYNAGLYYRFGVGLTPRTISPLLISFFPVERASKTRPHGGEPSVVRARQHTCFVLVDYLGSNTNSASRCSC